MSNYCDINDRQFYTCIALYMVSVISCTYSVRLHTRWCTHMKWVQDTGTGFGNWGQRHQYWQYLPIFLFPVHILGRWYFRIIYMCLSPHCCLIVWPHYMERQCITRWGQGLGRTKFHKQLGAGLIHCRNILCVVQSTYKLLCLRNGLFG